ncbi:MAG: glycosyltransferase family 4 protein [Bacteroidetes bacterium]|nr:glycosyltransferase family 4 protein [Bacteroidota bacterium]
MAGFRHLLILTPGFPESEDDTTCLPYLQQFILTYKQLHPELKITILSLHYPFNKSHYHWNSLPVYCMQGKNKHGLRRAYTIYKAYKQGIAIHKADNIDHVLSIWITDAALAGKHIAQKAKVPFFTWAWGQDVKPGNKYLKLVNPNEDHLAVMSAFQNNILKLSYGIEAKHIIPNGIMTELFPPLNTGKRDIDLLAVGSLIPLKQYHLFIELVKWLKENGHHKINAILVGDGELLYELKSMITGYALEDNITLTGALPYARVLDLMNNAKIFVHPSSYEGHSTVMLEAMYSGCKTVAFLPSGVNDENSFMLCNDIESMKVKVTELLAKPLQYKRVIYATWDENVKRIHSILSSL